MKSHASPAVPQASRSNSFYHGHLVGNDGKPNLDDNSQAKQLADHKDCDLDRDDHSTLRRYQPPVVSVHGSTDLAPPTVRHVDPSNDLRSVCTSERAPRVHSQSQPVKP